MKTIILTSEEKTMFEAFKREQHEREAIEKRRNECEAYKAMVDNQIDESFENLTRISNQLKDKKRRILEDFNTAIAIKSELFRVKECQRTHTFTNSDGNKRIMIGNYSLDNYRDTVNEGIAIVKEVVASLAKDAESKAMVNAILKLLSKDQKGNLKPSRVLQLRKMAEDLQHKRLLTGVRLIEESYQPALSKMFIRAEYKSNDGSWTSIPLGMTEA